MLYLKGSQRVGDGSTLQQIPCQQLSPCSVPLESGLCIWGNDLFICLCIYLQVQDSPSKSCHTKSLKGSLGSSFAQCFHTRCLPVLSLWVGVGGMCEKLSSDTEIQ